MAKSMEHWTIEELEEEVMKGLGGKQDDEDDEE